MNAVLPLAPYGTTLLTAIVPDAVVVPVLNDTVERCEEWALICKRVHNSVRRR